MISLSSGVDSGDVHHREVLLTASGALGLHSVTVTWLGTWCQSCCWSRAGECVCKTGFCVIALEAYSPMFLFCRCTSESGQGHRRPLPSRQRCGQPLQRARFPVGDILPDSRLDLHGISFPRCMLYYVFLIMPPAGAKDSPMQYITGGCVL